jgi:ABC-type transport system involved in multi-copper enzyme maturation permease subunit
MEQEIRKADVQYKKRVMIIFVIFFSLLIIGYFIINSWSQRLIQNDDNAEIAIQKAVMLIKFLAYSVSVVSIFFGLYFFKIGYLIFHYKEFPPKTMKVMYDTPIKRGKKAVEKAVISFVMSGLILTIAVIFPIFTHKILQTMGF